MTSENVRRRVCQPWCAPPVDLGLLVAECEWDAELASLEGEIEL